MSNKNAIPVLLIATLVVASAFIQTGEALSECAKPCMPVCLNEKGATIPMCETACEDYCKQASGSDPSQGPVARLDSTMAMNHGAMTCHGDVAHRGCLGAAQLSGKDHPLGFFVADWHRDFVVNGKVESQIPDGHGTNLVA
ncbi:hypothetical protein TIFTF001_003214 [Ficus carica]|uniref:Plant thionin family protein n=1 Tax=Ficus carica TaxID=3494 RepID=A0AA87Z842_FICCA|nr:hypothetical protein TIFTF001_003214 [Ficus carica]